MKMEFMPKIKKNFNRFLWSRTSIHQYERARKRSAQPPEASTNELVAIRLMMGVMPVQSKPKPSSKHSKPAPTKYFTFKAFDLLLNNSWPAIAPQMVCALVEMQFMATQPSGLILRIKSQSI